MLQRIPSSALRRICTTQTPLRNLFTASSKLRASSSRSEPPNSAIQNLPKTASSPAEPVAPKTVSLQYFVSRTPSNNLPVYQDIKGGSTKKLTVVRKITGDIASLQQDLQSCLGLEEEKFAVNRSSMQIHITGWVKEDVVKFLQERDF